VKVPAGTFNAIKVRVEHFWRPAYSSGVFNLSGGRSLMIWYSPELKRAIKFSSRQDFGSATPVEADFDLELVSYKLN
jgi:hypothetical protein